MLASVNWDTYWLYVLAEAALSLSPGPAVMLVIAYGLGRGARKSVPATLGILAANTFYFALSATGLGALLAASHLFFVTVKWLGAAYLVWLAMRAIFGHASPITISRPPEGADSFRSIFLSGLTLQIGNPKTLIFFAAILPQFVDPHLPIGAQMVWLAAGSVLPEFFILLGYGYLASRLTHIATDVRYARWTDRAAGVLVLAAAALVLTVTA